MARRAALGEFEHLVLLAALSLGEEAYAPAIATRLEQRAKREMSRGTLYAGLERLEKRGLLTAQVEPGSAKRGGRRRRRFVVTADGIEMLIAQREVLFAMWEGLDALLQGGN